MFVLCVFEVGSILLRLGMKDSVINLATGGFVKSEDIKEGC